ncbi:hypothetical protein MC7420_630 [Coleofasciculus chthonoplastes PCC 7420]|uniref:Uncharacterized protein n=1 Tax=Coleofasciculus chthonoplastes PCC 7420 TaxID=118168 RepID=B4VLS4_9CYAN|nr:hypothetical protein MC7420_630 [Coleofasciculus chthonoplastes PCC 7420]
MNNETRPASLITEQGYMPEQRNPPCLTDNGTRKYTIFYQ